MRPNVSVPESEQYECPSCGTRETDPDEPVCPGCGASLRYLGHSRDL